MKISTSKKRVCRNFIQIFFSISFSKINSVIYPFVKIRMTNSFSIIKALQARHKTCIEALWVDQKSSCGVYMTEILNDLSWKKAYELIEDKYGKRLSYRSIKLFAESNASFYSHGDDLIIPLKLKSHDLGDIVVSRGSLLDIQQKYEILDLVKFLIEPKIYNIHLKQSEENLKVKDHAEDGKVVDLFKLNTSKSKTLSQIIHLQSHKELNRHKVAMKIHEMAEKNLFVHLDDIAASLTSVEDIRTLSDLTVYVDDVESLTPSMIDLLKRYLDLADINGPLFLIGSNLSYDDIETKDWPASLKKDLMGFYFDIDRVPLSQQTSSEILELLFFQLDNEMT